MSQLRAKLEQYDFPVLLAAEWGHPDRLLKLLDASDTPQVRKIKIISLLGEMQADEALPQLKAALKDKNLSKEAAVALGSMGKDGIPILVDILKHSKQPELQAAAAKVWETWGTSITTRRLCLHSWRCWMHRVLILPFKPRSPGRWGEFPTADP